MQPSKHQATSEAPLFVDLDGTFIRSDMLLESALLFVKAHPFKIYLLLVWLLKGKAYLKNQLFDAVKMNVVHIPLNQGFYDYLTNEKAKGRRIILATASNQGIAQQFVQHYSVFDDYLASDDKHNLKGKNKLLAIQARSANFCYAGNGPEDFVLFEQAQSSILVAPTMAARTAYRRHPTDLLLDVQSPSLAIWMQQIRLHQWLKNVLIFVPMLVSGAYLSLLPLVQTITGVFAFGCLASATYIINDLLDLEADRQHPRKKFRPLACGSISIVAGLSLCLCLFVISMSLALSINMAFFAALILYLLVTLSYSFVLKQYIGIDVITLAGLYTIRLLAGAQIIHVTISFWLLSFSMFIFLSLALVKRCSELKSLEHQGKSGASGRDYQIADYPVLQSLGLGSGLLALLMFSFYINSNALSNQYQQPTYLWLIIPAMCYWIMRMWIKTNRGEMHDDPIVYSIKDKGSLIMVTLIGCITVAAQIL